MASNPESSSFDVGTFRTRATFLNNTPIPNGSGGAIDNYTSFFTCWGQLRKNGGRRNLLTGEIILENDYTLNVRYCSNLEENLNLATQVQVGPRTFTIQSYIKIEQLNFFYSFQLKQKDN